MIPYQEAITLTKDTHGYLIQSLCDQKRFSSRLLQGEWGFSYYGEKATEVIHVINETLIRKGIQRLPEFSLSGNKVYYLPIQTGVYLQVKYTDEWLTPLPEEEATEAYAFQGVEIDHLYIEDIDSIRLFSIETWLIRLSSKQELNLLEKKERLATSLKA